MTKTLYYKDQDFDERVQEDAYIDFELEVEINDEICLEYLMNQGLTKEQAKWVYSNFAWNDVDNFDDAICEDKDNEYDWLSFLKDYFLDEATEQYLEEEKERRLENRYR